MNANSCILVLTALLLASCPNARADDDARTPAPKATTESTTKLKEWLAGLKDKSEGDVIAEFGKGGVRGTWDSGRKKELKLTFHFDNDTTLMLFFYDGKVLKSGLLLNG